ncbi:hypothetical protein CIHG_00048 [Coccidioides immitis H538.4]|uniref:Uncharacterized protein n=1 Tax=Coccidioides immitis H538.4 TaxID=396776 RepID=A0A0J8RCL4_COCIT|nr:hypothetical protein CIHG_00048 [Coccidioides immitis H538.4]
MGGNELNRIEGVGGEARELTGKMPLEGAAEEGVRRWMERGKRMKVNASDERRRREEEVKGGGAESVRKQENEGNNPPSQSATGVKYQLVRARPSASPTTISRPLLANAHPDWPVLVRGLPKQLSSLDAGHFRSSYRALSTGRPGSKHPNHPLRLLPNFQVAPEYKPAAHPPKHCTLRAYSPNSGGLNFNRIIRIRHSGNPPPPFIIVITAPIASRSIRAGRPPVWSPPPDIISRPRLVMARSTQSITAGFRRLYLPSDSSLRL